MTTRPIASALVLAGALATATTFAAQPHYVPQRVFHTASGDFTDFEAMLADAATADVVFVGEQHDDPNTHRLERATLEGLLRRGASVVVSLEMFERDVQSDLDRFRRGLIGEGEFLAGARPWPRYATDYKPLVDLAVAHEWPVIAANVPRPLASEVSREGADVLDGKPDAERAWFARERQCPVDSEYFSRFAEAMGGHPGEGADAMPREQVERFYLSQCLKDETMAESIARSAGQADGPVVHFNGAFHSDFGFGTAARLRRRLPDARVVIVTILPVDDLDVVAPDEEALRRGDYLVYTLAR